MSAPTAVLYVPLARAMACLDCGGLFESGFLQCPACASEAIIPIARWLDRDVGGQ